MKNQTLISTQTAAGLLEVGVPFIDQLRVVIDGIDAGVDGAVRLQSHNIAAFNAFVDLDTAFSVWQDRFTVR